MALGSNHVTNTTAATFIPEIWSDEIIASYEKSLVVKPLVRAMSMVGKKGDTIHIPKPDRGDATAKAAETQVTLIAGNTGECCMIVFRNGFAVENFCCRGSFFQSVWAMDQLCHGGSENIFCLP